MLLALLNDPRRERQEVYRLHEWLQRVKLTGIITVKAAPVAMRTGDDRFGYLDFMADTVVQLTHNLEEPHGISARADREISRFATHR